VGICFGHQLIAHALGGEAQKADAGWGIGIHAARLTQPQEWMENGNLQTPERYNLVVIHQDQVVKLPPGFDTIAENDFCPVSMYVGENVMFGIQAHPEFDKEFCEFRINYRKEILGPDLTRQALDSLDQMELDSGQVLGWISQFIRS
jgi:GMP synthase-like glutamine amidotransferase